MKARSSAENGNSPGTGTLGRCALPLALLAFGLTGCVSSPTTPAAGSEDPDGLYSGEPVALHATEIPVASAAEARARAAEALAEGDTDLALYLLVQAVNLDPEDSQSLYAIGAIHEDRGNTDLAARAYARVLEREPDHVAANQGLGLMQFERREFESAEEYLSAAIALDPSLWRAHNTLGILADRAERYAAAISHYTAAIEAQPTNASIRNNRGYSRYLAGDLEAARLDFLAALEIDRSYERAWRNLGLVLAREQEYERAVGTMANAIPRHVALNDVGYVAMLDGNYAVARRFFQDAIRESPRHYQTAQDNLAELGRRSNAAPALVSTE